MFSTKVVHLFRKTRTRFYRVIRQKTRTNIEIDNNPPYHDENFPHQSRVSLRLYQNPSPNSKANRKLSVEPNQEYLVVNLFKKVSKSRHHRKYANYGNAHRETRPAHNQSPRIDHILRE